MVNYTQTIHLYKTNRFHRLPGREWTKSGSFPAPSRCKPWRPGSASGPFPRRPSAPPADPSPSFPRPAPSTTPPLRPPRCCKPARRSCTQKSPRDPFLLPAEPSRTSGSLWSRGRRWTLSVSPTQTARRPRWRRRRGRSPPPAAPRTGCRSNWPRRSPPPRSPSRRPALSTWVVSRGPPTWGPSRCRGGSGFRRSIPRWPPQCASPCQWRGCLFGALPPRWRRPERGRPRWENCGFPPSGWGVWKKKFYNQYWRWCLIKVYIFNIFLIKNEVLIIMQTENAYFTIKYDKKLWFFLIVIFL